MVKIKGIQILTAVFSCFGKLKCCWRVNLGSYIYPLDESNVSRKGWQNGCGPDMQNKQLHCTWQPFFWVKFVASVYFPRQGCASSASIFWVWSIEKLIPIFFWCFRFLQKKLHSFKMDVTSNSWYLKSCPKCYKKRIFFWWGIPQEILKYLDLSDLLSNNLADDLSRVLFTVKSQSGST